MPLCELAESLVAAGHEAVHVPTYGPPCADADQILARAAAEGRVLVSCGNLRQVGGGRAWPVWIRFIGLR